MCRWMQSNRDRTDEDAGGCKEKGTELTEPEKGQAFGIFCKTLAHPGTGKMVRLGNLWLSKVLSTGKMVCLANLRLSKVV